MSFSNCETTMPVVPAGYGGYGGGGMGWGGDWGAWIILFLIFGMFGWGGFGGMGGMNGGVGSEVQRGFDNQGVMNKLNGIEQGICSLGYDQLGQMNGINTNILQTGFGLQNTIQQNTVAGMQNTNAIQTQLSGCCCETQRLMERGFCDTNYNNQNNTRDIIDNANANARALMDFMVQDKLAAKDAKIAALENQVSQANQNAVLGARIDAATAEILRRTGHDCPSAAYIVQPPTPVNFPTNGCGTFMGFNTGCGQCA